MAPLTTDRPPAPVPPGPTRAALSKALGSCRACDLWEHPTQPVVGEGSAHAKAMLVGEQSGDREDIEGHPFLGPAGRVRGQGLGQAGIAREDVYVTNVVKHFRYQARASAGSIRNLIAGRCRPACPG